MCIKGSAGIPTRVVLALLCATGVMELYMTRANLSIAIVAMVQIVSSANNTIEDNRQEPFCTTLTNNSRLSEENNHIDTSLQNSNKSQIFQNEEPEDFRLKLTSTQRGLVLSAFFYVYGITALLGGRLAERYGTKRVFGTAVFVDAVGNLLIPLATKSNYYFLLVIRIVMGLCQGACYPSLHHLVSVWMPADETTRFISFVYPASCFGTIFALNICGLIISKLGWEPAFYICGSIGLVWLVSWILLMHDSPLNHPRITEEEKKYILNSRRKSSEKVKNVPWLKIMSSLPFWAATVAHCSSMFGLSLLLTQLPIYMSSIIGMNIRTNGVLSSLPFLARYLGCITFESISTCLKKRVKWQDKTIQRLLAVFGFWGASASYLMVGYIGCNGTAAIVLFVTGMVLNGAIVPAYGGNLLQLAPNFAGSTLGIATSIAFFYAMLGPVIVGVLTPEETLGEWIAVYWIVFANSFVAGAFFMAFLSTDIQSWNKTVSSEEEGKHKQELIMECEMEDLSKL